MSRLPRRHQHLSRGRLERQTLKHQVLKASNPQSNKSSSGSRHNTRPAAIRPIAAPSLSARQIHICKEERGTAGRPLQTPPPPPSTRTTHHPPLPPRDTYTCNRVSKHVRRVRARAAQPLPSPRPAPSFWAAGGITKKKLNGDSLAAVTCHDLRRRRMAAGCWARPCCHGGAVRGRLSFPSTTGCYLTSDEGKRMR